MNKLAAWLAPKSDSPVQRIRALLVMLFALGIFLALFALISYWVLTGTLESLSTVLAGLIFGLMLLSIARLAQVGKIDLSAWLLGLLLSMIIFLDVAEYGFTASIAASVYALPVVFSALALGLAPALFFAFLGAVVMWVLAFAMSQGWLANSFYHESFLSFHAPALTLYYFLLALMVGGWNRALHHTLGANDNSL
jgi:hypothetical protein